MPVPELEDLLLSLFTGDELKRFVSRHLRKLSTTVNWSASLAQVAFDVAAAADRRGLIDDALWTALRADFPGRRSDIDRVAALFAAGPSQQTVASRVPAGLVLASVGVTPPPEYSSAAELRFHVLNPGSGKLVLDAVMLHVTLAEPSDTLRMVQAGAPIPQHHYRVRLDPDERNYDVRARTFGEAEGPRSFVEDEVEAFLVELTSTRPFRYRFRVELEWYDTKRPDVRRVTSSEELEVDFPPTPEELLARAEPESNNE